MITEEDYLKAKKIVQEYESNHLNISDVTKRFIDGIHGFGNKCYYEGRFGNFADSQTYSEFLRFLDKAKDDDKVFG